MKIFEVPRKTVQVRALLYGGSEVDGVLYIDPTGPCGGPGLLSDRLNDPAEAFLPLRTEARGFLVQKSRLVAVEVLDEELNDEQAACDLEGFHRVDVHLQLVGGRQIDGKMAYVMPPGRSRLLDYLNEAPRFVPVFLEPGLILVNREYIVSLWNAGEGDAI